MKPVFVALTGAGLETARRAAAAVGGEVHAVSRTFSQRETPALHPDQTFTDTASHLRALFESGRPIVGICAAGILIRIVAPLLSNKREEPPVLAVSEDGANVIPLLGGHRGANELAREIAAALGGHAAITTAGDNRFGVALDAPPEGWTLANPDDAKGVMAALLGGASARLEGEAPWLAESRIPFAADGTVRLIATVKGFSPHRGEDGRAERRSGEEEINLRDPLTRPLRGHPLSDGERNAAAPTSPSGLALVYHPRRLAVGLGCERGASPEEVFDLAQQTLAEAGLTPASVALVTSIDLKADEPAILEAAARLGVPARFFTAATLEAETPRLKTPSEAVFREVGCHGVAEGGALAAVGRDGALVVAKRKSARATCAIAEAPGLIDVGAAGRARGRLAVVGIGPGSADWLTPEAKQLLEESDAVVGYSLYLDLVVPLIAQAERFDSKLGSEEARVRQALALAAEGRSVALVSSGDAGIYAMATLVFECLDGTARASAASIRPQQAELVPPPSLPTGAGDHAEHGGRGGHIRQALPSPPPPPSVVPLPRSAGEELSDSAHRIEIVVSPGISAMQAAAARAGAPLGHDFCAISLSDLLTPWETIEARIRAAAEGDFVIAFYNPVSERRRTQLAAAKEILLRHRPADTPVVLAKNLGRTGESVATITLGDLEVEMVDMLTLVLVGASTTRMMAAGGRAWTYTPRGYEKKRPSPPATRVLPSGSPGNGSREHPTSSRGRDGEGGETLPQPSSFPPPYPPPQGGRG